MPKHNCPLRLADARIQRLFKPPNLCHRTMNMIVNSVIGAALLLSGSAVEPQQRRSDQDAARAARQEGRILPLREIENRVVPQMRGAQYIGFDFDSSAAVYTLKFLRDGSVIWVTVDGRSGTVIGRAGG